MLGSFLKKVRFTAGWPGWWWIGVALFSVGSWENALQEKKPAVESTNGESKPNKKEKEKKESGKKTEAKNGHGSETNHSLANLSQQLDVAEEAQVQCAGDISRRELPEVSHWRSRFYFTWEFSA